MTLTMSKVPNEGDIHPRMYGFVSAYWNPPVSIFLISGELLRAN